MFSFRSQIIAGLFIDFDFSCPYNYPSEREEIPVRRI